MAQITLPLDIESLEIISQGVDEEGNIILKVRSKKDYSTCHKCGKHATKPHGKASKLTIRHLPILDTPVYLIIDPIRYQCEHYDDHPTTTALSQLLKSSVLCNPFRQNYAARA